jgi:cyclophilin family peptidyl-prolyl cis-trans isomerase
MRTKAIRGGGLRAQRASRVGPTWGFEPLEQRQMLSVTLGSLHNVELPAGNSVLVPLTGLDSGGDPLTYEFTSSDPSVTLSLISPTSKSLVLNVTGTDSNDQSFSGTLIIHLFEDLAPVTTARIEQLVTSGFYNNAPFSRVVDGFVAQGGDNGSGGTGQLLHDELSSGLTFVSPGLLSLANRGRDTADSQFFITATNEANSSTPISLAHMPQALNFRFTIFGQLVSGFSTFEKIMTTPVEFSSVFNETSQPINDVTIVSASLINDTQNAVLKMTAPASFVGNSATITLIAKNADNEMDEEVFAVGVVADATTDPPFLGAVANKTATAGSPISFTLTSTSPSGGGITYKVASASNFSTPANVTVSINQSTGVVTLTPAANFTGTINLLAGVRATSATDVQNNYDTEAFSLTVTAADPGSTPAAPTGLGVAAASNTGAFDGNGYVSTATPTLTVTAVSGATVKFKIGATEVATGVETASGSGVYTSAIPAGKLAVGANAVTAIVTTTGGTSTDSTALSLVFAPDYATGVYAVPGVADAAQQLVMQWVARNASYANEIGFFVADSASGAIGGIAPGAAGYAKAALSSTTRQVVFAQGQGAGASKTVTLNGGQSIVFYLIQNNTTANFLAKNSTNALHGNNNGGAPLAFFSALAANPDHMRHTQIVADQTTGRVQYNWEDLVTLGDSDFNDAVMRVSLAAASSTPSGTLHAPGTGDKTTTLNATLAAGTNQAATLGDVGVFFVDSPSGAIGSLTPGAPGYAAAALANGNTRVLFTSGKAAGATAQATVPAGKYLAFYVLSSGTTATFLTANPTNSSSGSTVAMFSFDAANANGVNHFRWFAPGQQATDPSQMQLHIMDQVFGDDTAFDDLALNLKFTA